MATQDNFIKTALRLPPDLHREVTGAAESKGRSLNAEMIARLQNASSVNQSYSEILEILRVESQAERQRIQPHVMQIATAISLLPEPKVRALAELLGVMLMPAKGKAS